VQLTKSQTGNFGQKRRNSDKQGSSAKIRESNGLKRKKRLFYKSLWKDL
jgi:hypothetical protein